MSKAPQRGGFNGLVLGSIALASLGAVSLMVLAPVSHETHAPKAVMPVVDLDPVMVRNKSGQKGGVKSEFAKKGISVVHLEKSFEKIGYDLEQIRIGNQPVPRLFVSALPRDMDSIKQIDTRKALFFRSILPLVLQVNEELEQKRKRLWSIKFAKSIGAPVSALDRLWLEALADEYKVPEANLELLLTRVDTLPTSLVLAQAAEESGWGTSRFVREGNALFGQWTFDNDDHGIVPQSREDGKTHRIKAFPSLIEGLREYVHNLNTHRAYSGLRKVRAAMRRRGLPLNGAELATTLDKYSERGYDYVASLQGLISANDLAVFDQVRLGDYLPRSGPMI